MEKKGLLQKKTGKKRLSAVWGFLCLVLCLSAAGIMFGQLPGQMVTAEAAVKKTAKKTAQKTAAKEAAKKKAAKKEKEPSLNVNSKTIMKVKSGLLTTYEEYVAYPMNAYTLKVNNKPENATYKWKTTNSNIVSLIYDKKKGTCRVKAKEGGSCIVTCTVKTKKKEKYVFSASIKVKYPATKIQIVTEDAVIENMECDLQLERGYQFLANVKSKYTSDLVYWSSSDSTVAAVDEAGYVTPKAEGRAILTAIAAPKSYDPEMDREEDVVMYAIVVNVVEPMEEVTNVTVMTTGQIIVQFSAEIEKGSVHDVSGNLTGVSLKAMSGAAGTGNLDAYLTDDCLQLYIVPETAPNGKYKLTLEGLTAQNGHRVKDYEDTVTVKNETVSSTGANFVSISRTSVTMVTAVFDKTIINPGTLTVSDSKITKAEVQGKVGPDPSTVLYTLTPEMQELKGVVLVSLFGYAASGDSSEEGEENEWDVYMSFDYVDESQEEPLDTSDQPLPPPSNVTQAMDTNSMVYVVFQNRVDSESAENAANYTFNDGPVVTGAAIVENSDKGALIGLTIQESSIPEIKEYELTISNVKGYNDAYLPMETYSVSIKLNDNTPAYYTGSEFVRGGEKSDYAYQIILEFSENIDFGSVAKYFNLEASWIGKDEKGNTVPLTSSITMYEASATGSDNKITIGFDTEGELPVGAKINVVPINQGENSGTYLVDEGGNIVEFTSAEVQVSY